MGFVMNGEDGLIVVLDGNNEWYEIEYNKKSGVLMEETKILHILILIVIIDAKPVVQEQLLHTLVHL